MTPDLLDRLEPPTRVAPGYQVLPRIIPDPPPEPPAKPVVTRFSWRWSERLIETEIKRLAAQESELAHLPADGASTRARVCLAVKCFKVYIS